MIIVYLITIGLTITVFFLIYTQTIRPSDRPPVEDIPSHQMIGRTSDEITTGKVPKLMPRHIRSNEDE